MDVVSRAAYGHCHEIGLVLEFAWPGSGGAFPCHGDSTALIAHSVSLGIASLH